MLCGGRTAATWEAASKPASGTRGLLHCCAAAGDTAVPQRSLYAAKAFGCWAHRELQEPNHA